MLINNLTDRTIFLLRSRGDGVSLPPGETEFPDALYTGDPVFNQAVDSLVADERVSLTDAPTDPFPTGTGGGAAESPLTLTANSVSERPLTLEVPAGTISSGALAVKIANGGPYVFTAGPQGNEVDNYDPAIPGFAIYAAAAQTADLLDVFDEHGTLVFQVSPVGDLYIGSQGETSLRPNASSFAGSNPSSTPLSVFAADGQSAPAFLIVGGAGQTANLFDVLDENGKPGFSVFADGSVCCNFDQPASGGPAAVLQLFGDASPNLFEVLGVYAAQDQTTPLFQAWAATDTSSPSFRIDADGTVHIKTGTSVIADL